MSRQSFCLAAILLILEIGEAAAQRVTPFDSIDTPHGMCAVWLSIPGFTGSADTTFNRCAVDSGPDLVSPHDLPTPRIERSARGWITVVVRPDGTVDVNRTRPWTGTIDTSFDQALLERVRSWRFRPGMRGGQAVRAGFTLKVESDIRTETEPSKLIWSYRRGLNEDSLIGKWERLPPVAPLAREEMDSVFSSLVRELQRRRILGLGGEYCLVDEAADTSVYLFRAVLLRRLLGSQRPIRRGCEKLPELRRLQIVSVYPTEADRVVVDMAGDWLDAWPPGFDGQAYRAWKTRCVADRRAPGGEAPSCHVIPVHESPTRYNQRNLASIFTLPGAPAQDTFRVAVVARTTEAVTNDTLYAVVDVLADWKDYGSWHGAPPVVHCDARLGCKNPEVLPPEQRELAERAHVRFLLADLRPLSRNSGAWLHLRIHTNRRSPSHTPLVVVRRGDHWTGRAAREIAWGVWEYGVNVNLDADTEVRVYIVRGGID